MLTDEQIDMIRCHSQIPQATDREYLQLTRADTRVFARAIEAEVRKDDEALIRQMLEALETGHEAAMQVAAEFHESYKGHRPDTHAALDADIDQIAKALTAARARLEKAP